MLQAQAFVHSCDDFRIQKTLQQFFENNLNLYAVDLQSDMGGAKSIFEGGIKRDLVFENIEASISQHQVNRIILINHTDCEAYGGSSSFKTSEEEVNTHELELRHAVSDVKARFPQKEVEAYLLILGSSGKIVKVV